MGERNLTGIYLILVLKMNVCLPPRSTMRTIRRLALDFERAIDYYYLRQRPGRHIILGLVNGMARGVGFAIGVSVLAFVLVQILQALNVLELPIIGDFIARLLDYVEEARRIGIEKY